MALTLLDRLRNDPLFNSVGMRKVKHGCIRSDKTVRTDVQTENLLTMMVVLRLIFYESDVCGLTKKM